MTFSSKAIHAGLGIVAKAASYTVAAAIVGFVFARTLAKRRRVSVPPTKPKPEATVWN